jgi:hypothetical protein
MGYHVTLHALSCFEEVLISQKERQLTLFIKLDICPKEVIPQQHLENEVNAASCFRLKMTS